MLKIWNSKPIGAYHTPAFVSDMRLNYDLPCTHFEIIFKTGAIDALERAPGPAAWCRQL